MIPVASGFFYGLGFGLPIIVFLLIRFLFGIDFTLMTSISVYGYSFTILVPIMFLCCIPSNIVKIVVLGYGLVTSLAFLLYNMFHCLEGRADKSKFVILGIVLLFQLGSYLTLKLYFFKGLDVIGI